MQRDLADADSLFLRGPEEREIDSFGQGLSGELSRLATCGDRFNDLRCKGPQPDQSSHVTRTDRANLVAHRGERP